MLYNVPACRRPRTGQNELSPERRLSPGERVWIRATVRISPDHARSPCGRATVRRCGMARYSEHAMDGVPLDNALNALTIFSHFVPIALPLFY